MIRINLLRSTGMTTSAPVMSGFGGGGGTQVVVVDQEKIGGLKLVVILLFPILLYGYEYMNISSLEAQKTEVEAQAAAVEGKRAAYGDAGPKVEKYTKEKQRIDSQLGTIRELSKGRLREVKTLDSLQSLTPPQVWFDSIKIEGNLVHAAGYSITDEGLSALFSSLNSSPVFSKFEPKSQSQEQTPSGQRIVKFEVEFVIGGRQETL
jgi:Tfp pilus assembly protein PilN